MFFEYHNMNLKDIASRLKCSVSTIKKHFTMQGFMRINVKTLQKYAIIFDVSVGDFFQFLHVNDKISVSLNKTKNRIIQDITISTKNDGKNKK